MQANVKKDGSIDVFLVRNGVSEYVTTVNERAENDLRTYYERQGLGKFLRIVPVITKEDKEKMQELAAKIAPTVPQAQEPTKLDFIIEAPKKRSRKTKK